MLIPDVNLLIYAYDLASPHHAKAKMWWEELLNGSRMVGLPWLVILGFLRIATNRRAQTRPMETSLAIRHVRQWLARPQVRIVTPGDRHAETLLGLLEQIGVAGNLTTDAHLAALTIEYRAELATADADFSRFPGLRWKNPLTSR